MPLINLDDLAGIVVAWGLTEGDVRKLGLEFQPGKDFTELNRSYDQLILLHGRDLEVEQIKAIFAEFFITTPTTKEGE